MPKYVVFGLSDIINDLYQFYHSLTWIIESCIVYELPSPPLILSNTLSLCFTKHHAMKMYREVEV